MFRLALAVLVGLGAGVALMDQLAERKATKARPVAQQAVLGLPVICDATVEQRTKPTDPWSHKCYVAKFQR